ncbi:aromatic ring-hydroxylating dioxygenase subunit alpha [Sphingomonas sp. CGMCC 1.13654]|uniref:Aromatic ring-hydroxylating dioxygenase subunit alpha n=1 Tax=Sphingomonas chungangi TaxID=2683589 RepID=A0A838L5F6_9SPHN|nr:aromatic ring-hydroxylating dioxygenase subunit alpha [Sphingomonas chungangi]MBA2933925.1 aromatic ring-hydroxylating dioxygenase subunit alpha [Sphingomonas chungangi]MVW57053.1 Rieske 2Fe-2S domain-containing protein [Sphingomonas chungangi]
MDRHIQIKLVERLREADPRLRWSHADRSMANPAGRYVDEDWFRDERQALFRECAQFVGLSVECARPGDYLTRDCGGVPILIVRQPDLSLRAFVNACRHRAAPLLKGDGSQGRRPIVCPYHAWTYGTDGSLLARPHDEGGFDDVADPCGLLVRSVVEAHGLIFVHPLEGATVDAADLLHGAEREFAGYGIESAHLFDRRETVWPINWKLLLDTFLEPYHVRFVHRNSIDRTFLSHQLFDVFGPVARPIGLRRSVLDQLESCRPSDWRLFPHAAAQYVLLPNALLSYQGDHIETWRFEPIDCFSTRVVTSIFSPSEPASEEERAHWQRNFDILLQVAFEEDFPIQKDIQDNLRSGAIGHVHYGRLEPALIHCHGTINAMVEAWRDKRGGEDERR